MRRLPALLAAIVLLCALAGCTGALPGPGAPAPVDTSMATTAPDGQGSADPSPMPRDATGEPAPADPSPQSPASPIDLVGLWRVSGAEGEAVDTWLRLGAGDVVLWRPCGLLYGEWAADGSDFFAGINGASQDCAPPETDWTDIPWLLSASAFERAGAGWKLVDDGGRVVATLSSDGAPDAIDTADRSLAQSPPVDDSVREFLAAPSPLPDGLTPADALSMMGAWIPAAGSFEADPGVTFVADGSFRASDGCNGLNSRWSVPEPGRLLSLGGAMTQVGCDGAPVPEWVASAARAGFDGDELVLVDSDGAELGRLIRG